MGDKSSSVPLARDVMTTHVLKANSDWPVEQLAEFLVENSISGAPVVNAADELVGVVSLTDLARNDTQSHDPRAADRHAFYLQVLELDSSLDTDELGTLSEREATVKVREIMTPVLIAVAEETPVTEVAHKMVESRIHRLFVTRQEKVVGVITALDMLRVVRDMA